MLCFYQEQTQNLPLQIFDTMIVSVAKRSRKMILFQLYHGKRNAVSVGFGSTIHVEANMFATAMRMGRVLVR